MRTFMFLGFDFHLIAFWVAIDGQEFPKWPNWASRNTIQKISNAFGIKYIEKSYSSALCILIDLNIPQNFRCSLVIDFWVAFLFEKSSLIPLLSVPAVAFAAEVSLPICKVKCKKVRQILSWYLTFLSKVFSIARKFLYKNFNNYQPGMRKRKRSAGSAASGFVGGYL